MFIKLISNRLPGFKKNEGIIRSGTDYSLFFISLFAFGIAVWDTGFPQSGERQQAIDFFYKVYFAVNGLFYIGRSLLLFRIRHLSAVAITNFALGALLLFEYSLSLIFGKPYILGSFFHLAPVYKTFHGLILRRFLFSASAPLYSPELCF
jgi:hypothetical protein